MFSLTYKSKFALCVAGAFAGVFLSALGLVSASSNQYPLNLVPVIDGVAHFAVALNLAVAAIAAILSLMALGVDILEAVFFGNRNRYR